MNQPAVGTLIKIRRKEKQLSQEQLSYGICAVSYLSKIENGEKEASQEIISKLLKELDITCCLDDSFIQNGKQAFTKFNELVFGFFTAEALELFEKIRQERRKYIYSPIIFEYLIMELAYYSLQNLPDRKKAQTTFKILETVNDFDNPDLSALYHFYKSLYLKQDHPQTARNLLETLVQQVPRGYSLYQLAELQITHNDCVQAIKNLESAESCFLHEGNYRGIIFSNHFLGISYSIMKDNDRALSNFENVIKLLDTANSQDEYILAFKYFAVYNIAEIAFFQQDFQKMQQYCNIIIDRQNSNPSEIYSIMPYLLMSKYYFNLGKMKKAREHFLLADNNWSNVINNEKDIEKGFLGLLAFMLENPNYLHDSSYHQLLIDLRKLCVSRNKFYIQQIVTQELIEYYKQNRQYKNALTLLEI